MPQSHCKGVALVQNPFSISIGVLCQNLAQMGNFGIDKVQLQTRDFSVKDASQQLFGYNISTRQGGGDIPFLFRDGKGFQVHANKLFRNSNLANYTINKYGLLIQFNPSARYHPYHLESTGQRFNDVITGIETDMKQAGISANLNAMKISRLDLTEQHQMVQPCFQYNNVFRLLKGKRCKNQKEYPTGYQIGNLQWQTVGYDKLQKLIDDKQFNLIEGEKNLLRIENKFLKHEAVVTHLKFDTLNVLKDISRNELRQHYTKHLNSKVLNRHLVTEQLYIDFENEKQLMAEIIGSTKSSTMAATAHLVTSAGANIADALLKFGGIEGYRKQILENFFSRRTTYRVIENISQLIALQAKADATRGEITVSSLLAELQAKFAA